MANNFVWSLTKYHTTKNKKGLTINLQSKGNKSGSKNSDFAFSEWKISI